jgi:isopentenyl diphosphate isomerase/L-lactate dehydrogenase-like FMN-dependent dehydrogenase
MEQKPVNPGDSNRITREYLDSLRIEMRHLDNVPPSIKMELYGRNFDTPIMTAAFSHLAGFQYHDDGMAEIARAAERANAVNWAGMGGEEELERIVATGAATIKIIKPYRDDERVFKKIDHARRLGALAVGMDIDHSFNRAGEYDKVFEDEMRPKTFEQLKSFVQAAGDLPFIVKGVLSVRDAEKCQKAGVRGIVVSHHHGIIDYAIPPLKILPRIVEAVGDEMPVFVDCGIATGYDAFKALALGATAVCVGRAVLDPLKEGGAEGASKYILQMTRELAGAMARTGSPDIRHIDRSVIWGG